MSEIEKATKRLNDAADKATLTTNFFDELTTAGNQSNVTNPNNNKTVPSVSKQVMQVYEEAGLNPDAISRQNQQLIRNLGEWQVGLTFENRGDYATFNNQAIITNENTPLPYTTQGSDPTVAPDAGDVVPFVEVQASDLVTVREDLLGPGTQLYMGDDGESVKVGDTVPAGTTHLRVEIGDNPALVAISPVASGSVTALSDTSITIGGITSELSTDTLRDKVSTDNASNEIYYAPAFVGAASRKMQSRLEDRVSVRDFGVLGDGTEETLKIQAAVDAVCGAGRNLVFPPPMVGSHYICQGVTFPNSSFKLTGDGGNTIVQFSTPDGVSNQNIFDLTGCNGPAKWISGLGFGRTTPGSYDGIVGIYTDGTNGLHLTRSWFRGLADGVQLNGSFFELDGNVFEYCAWGVNNTTNNHETIIRGATYYRNEGDILIPAGDNSAFLHTDSTHIGTKNFGVDVRGDNTLIKGVSAKDDGTGYKPSIVRIISGSSNIVSDVLSTYGSHLVKIEGSASVGNVVQSLSVPDGSSVDYGLFESTSGKTKIMGASIKQSNIAAVRLDTTSRTELHGVSGSGNVGLSVSATSQLRVFGGDFSGIAADSSEDASNSTNPRFYGTGGDLSGITSKTYV